VTLNDLERRNGLILRYFTKFGSFRGALRKTVEDTAKLDQIWCMGRSRRDMPIRMTSSRSKVKVTELPKLRKLRFSTSVSSAVFAWSSKLMVV